MAERQQLIDAALAAGTPPPPALKRIKIFTTFFWPKVTEDSREGGRVTEKGYFYEGVRR